MTLNKKQASLKRMPKIRSQSCSGGRECEVQHTLCETISAETPQMIRESRKHFSHRIGNWLGNKLNKKSNLNKVRHSIKFHLKDALKIAVGIGKEQSQEQMKNAPLTISSLKYAIA